MKRYRCELFLFLLLPGLAAQSPTLADEPLGDRVRRRVANDAVKCLSKKALVYGVDFSRSRELITESWASIEAAATPYELARSISTAFRAYEVSHLNVLSPTEMARWADGEDLWAGMRLVPSGSAFLVSMVVPAGPADRAGLQRDDRVTAIDGVDVSQDPEGIRGARFGADPSRAVGAERRDSRGGRRVRPNTTGRGGERALGG